MSKTYRKLSALPLLLVALPHSLQPQGQPPARTVLNAPTDPLLQGFRWRSIGPTGQGGRVNDVAVVESNPSTFYVGFATGGLWKTTNMGTTFEPIFDTYSTHSIGDLAVAPSDPNVLYVGTGEPNNRQSSSFGDGMFKSTDAGRTFTPIGLRETQSIARVIVHPRDPNTVWVAAVGRLFGPNAERGVYKTTDGGRTWNKILYFDENTGATDIVIHPRDPNILFAAMYTRRRTSWGFAAGSAVAGIYRSSNGGQTWTRVTGGGLPRGQMGRIALDFSRSNPDVIYAQIEVGPTGEPIQAGARAGQPQGGGGGGGGGVGGGGFGGAQNLPPDDQVSGIWRSSDGGRTWEFRSNENQRPMYFSQIAVDPANENVVYVAGVQARKSTDGARTFNTLVGMGHVDHHSIWINPANSQHVIYGNDGSIDISWDGGATWESLRHWAVGQPYHASVDMRRPYFVCTGLQDNGSWCGPSSVRAGPILGQDWYRVGGGDGFYTQVDPTDPNIMYSESQNGNINRLDLRLGTSISIRPRAPQRGPDGGANFGGAGPNVFPSPEPGTIFRWNWSTPLQISPHDASTILTGANRLFISRDRGSTWWMSAELTKAVNRDDREILGLKGSLPPCSRLRVGTCINSKGDGVSFYGTIISVAQSAIVPGVIWVGTDDGNVQVTRDGGQTFTEVGRNIPGGTREYYVSRVEPSYFDPATAYVSIDGHRHDDLKPYVYVTRDYGATWTSIASDLPEFGNVNTIRQDPRNRDLLYAGTEFGFFVSLDEGRAWKRFMPNLPVVRIDDVIVHPRDNDLILATHGRSIFILDDVSALQQMTPAAMQQEAVLFEPRNAVAWKADIRMRRSVTGHKNYEGENAPTGTAISYYLRNPAPGEVKITIRDLASGSFVRNIDGPRTAGLHRIQWNLCSDLRPVQPGQGGGFGGGGGGGGGGNPCVQGGGGGGQPPQVGQQARPGSYLVTLNVGGRELTRTVTVLEDTWMF